MASVSSQVKAARSAGDLKLTTVSRASVASGNVPFRVDLSRKEEVAVSPEPERISGAKPEGPP